MPATKRRLAAVPEQRAPEPPVPERPPVVEQAAKWTDEMLACRSLMHAWQQATASYSKRYRYYSLTLQCQRCGTVKHQELNGRGHITASWYEYPDGYLSSSGFITADDRGVIRLANLDRAGVRNLAGKPSTHRATAAQA